MRDAWLGRGGIIEEWGQFLRIERLFQVRRFEVGFIGRSALLKKGAALVRDHGQKQANDLRQEPDAMFGHDLSEHMPSIVIPATTLTRRTERVFVHARAVFTTAAGISLRGIS